MKQYSRGERGAHSGLKTAHSQYQTVAKRSKSHFQECYPRQSVTPGKQLQFLGANNTSQLESHTQFGAPHFKLLTDKERTAKIMVLANVAYKEQVTRLLGCLSQKCKRLSHLLPKNPQPNHNNLDIYSFNTQNCV